VQIENDIKLDFDDVLIRPKRSEMGSRSEVCITRAFKTMHSKRRWEGCPIISSNMDSTGTFAICEALQEFEMLTCLHKFYAEGQLIDFFNDNPASQFAFYSLGITDQDIEKLKSVIKHTNKIDKVSVDVANGYSKYFSDRVSQIRDLLPSAILMAGNVATAEMVQELIISGKADIIKVGIGPGSVCETRMVTGVGYPQLSAILEASDSAHGLGGLICADGGCRTPGDVVKAFGGGADFVMLGGMLAGTEECEGEWEHEYKSYIMDDGVPSYNINGKLEKQKKTLKFYGMSSREAMVKYSGGVAEYRATEGKCMSVPYKGPVRATVQQILGGLRSACAYVGASRLKDLSKCTTFVRVGRIHY